MILGLDEAKKALEQVGLNVSHQSDRGLFITATCVELDTGIKISNDATVLYFSKDKGQWIAGFPAEGMLMFEIDGSLAELVQVLKIVYAWCKDQRCSLSEAFRAKVKDADQYLKGKHR